MTKILYCCNKVWISSDKARTDLQCSCGYIVVMCVNKALEYDNTQFSLLSICKMCLSTPRYFIVCNELCSNNLDCLHHVDTKTDTSVDTLRLLHYWSIGWYTDLLPLWQRECVYGSTKLVLVLRFDKYQFVCSGLTNNLNHCLHNYNNDSKI